MPATQKTATKKSSAPARRSASRDAVSLLKADHKAVKALFKDYQVLVEADAAANRRQQLAQRICAMLTVHATIEEELFYPPARAALGEDADLVDEADVEHASAKQLIAEINSSSSNDPHYDARVKVLGEYINHHVKEEEGEMFAKLKKTDLDLVALGEALSQRKLALMKEHALPIDAPSRATAKAKASKKAAA